MFLIGSELGWDSNCSVAPLPALSEPSVLSNLLHGGDAVASPPTHPSFESHPGYKFSMSRGHAEFIFAEGVGLEPTRGFLDPDGLANRWNNHYPTPPKFLALDISIPQKLLVFIAFF